MAIQTGELNTTSKITDALYWLKLDTIRVNNAYSDISSSARAITPASVLEMLHALHPDVPQVRLKKSLLIAVENLKGTSARRLQPKTVLATFQNTLNSPVVI